MQADQMKNYEEELSATKDTYTRLSDYFKTINKEFIKGEIDSEEELIVFKESLGVNL